MADNNSYEINVTLDDFNAFITADKVVDENNQQLSNYVCNVTYTSLTKDQIHEIGQQFAKHLSDTDENGNSKAGLHKVALTGDYAQLENKPSASNLQGFKKVAFSGKTSDLTNDSGFLTINTNAYTNSPASQITDEDIENWNNKSDFSEDYNDLNNKPSLSAVALSGNYNDLLNKPISFNNFLNLNLYSNNTTSENNSNKFYQLGSNSAYIIDLNNFVQTEHSEIFLVDRIIQMFDQFLNYRQQLFILSNAGILMITNAKIEFDTNNIDTPKYIISSYINLGINNYETISSNYQSITLDNGDAIINDLTFSIINGILIFDFNKNGIICKIK